MNEDLLQLSETITLNEQPPNGRAHLAARRLNDYLRLLFFKRLKTTFLFSCVYIFFFLVGTVASSVGVIFDIVAELLIPPFFILPPIVIISAYTIFGKTLSLLYFSYLSLIYGMLAYNIYFRLIALNLKLSIFAILLMSINIIITFLLFQNVFSVAKDYTIGNSYSFSSKRFYFDVIFFLIFTFLFYITSPFLLINFLIGLLK